MEGNSFFRFFLFLIFSVVLLLFTLLNLPHAPSNKEELVDCTTYSPRCTSKNRFQSKKPHLLQNPPNLTRHHHPLDPLTVQEINKVRTILSSYSPFKSSSSHALHSIVLEDPDKPLVLRWHKGDPLPPRKASVIVRADGVSHVLTVNIDTSEVTQHEMGSISGYPTMTIEDMTSVMSAPFANADFNRSIIERGIDLADLAFLPLSTGWFGKAEEKRRLIKIQCCSMKDTVNFYMRPIEGLTVLVDIDTKEVVEISDKGRNIPVPKVATPNKKS